MKLKNYTNAVEKLIADDVKKQIETFKKSNEKPVKTKSPYLMAQIGNKKWYKVTRSSVFGLNVSMIVEENTETGDVNVINSFAGNGTGSSIIGGASLVSAYAAHGVGFSDDRNGGNNAVDVNNVFNPSIDNRIYAPNDSHKGKGHHK